MQSEEAQPRQMETDDSKQKIKFDNLYDLLFDQSGKQKQQADKRLEFTGGNLDFLDSEGANMKIIEQENASEELQKLVKQVKLVNPVPKFQAVPATPQFFDIAGAHLS